MARLIKDRCFLTYGRSVINTGQRVRIPRGATVGCNAGVQSDLSATYGIQLWDWKGNKAYLWKTTRVDRNKEWIQGIGTFTVNRDMELEIILYRFENGQWKQLDTSGRFYITATEGGGAPPTEGVAPSAKFKRDRTKLLWEQGRVVLGQTARVPQGTRMDFQTVVDILTPGRYAFQLWDWRSNKGMTWNESRYRRVLGDVEDAQFTADRPMTLEMIVYGWDGNRWKQLDTSGRINVSITEGGGAPATGGGAPRPVFINWQRDCYIYYYDKSGNQVKAHVGDVLHVPPGEHVYARALIQNQGNPGTVVFRAINRGTRREIAKTSSHMNHLDEWTARLHLGIFGENAEIQLQTVANNGVIDTADFDITVKKTPTQPPTGGEAPPTGGGGGGGTQPVTPPPGGGGERPPEVGAPPAVTTPPGGVTGVSKEVITFTLQKHPWVRNVMVLVADESGKVLKYQVLTYPNQSVKFEMTPDTYVIAAFKVPYVFRPSCLREEKIKPVESTEHTIAGTLGCDGYEVKFKVEGV